jgi:predicted Zn-dependent peptidase
MLFRGTVEHPSAHALSTAFEELGGSLDATTAADHGTVGIDVPNENLVKVLPLIGEVLRAPLFSDLELERSIIREEVLGDLGDDGEMIDPATLLRSLAFQHNGLGQPITGPIKNVESFTREQLSAHHQRTHIGKDLVVSVAGPLVIDQIQKDLEKALGDLPCGQSLKAESPSEQTEPRFLSVAHPGGSQTSLSVGYRCPGRLDRREPAVEMLLRVIDDGMATRLYHRLCDAKGLCYSASAGYEAYEDSGLVEFEVDTGHERAFEVLSEIFQLTGELAACQVTEGEWERLQKRARWQHESYLDEQGSTADFFAMAALTGTERTPALRLERLLAVTREEVRATAETLFKIAGRSVVCVGNPRKAKVDRLRTKALSR